MNTDYTLYPLQLLLNAGDAAEALSISKRKLWSLTAPRGPIPVVRIDRRTLYDPVDLAAFISTQKEGARP